MRGLILPSLLEIAYVWVAPTIVPHMHTFFYNCTDAEKDQALLAIQALPGRYVVFTDADVLERREYYSRVCALAVNMLNSYCILRGSKNPRRSILRPSTATWRKRTGMCRLAGLVC